MGTARRVLPIVLALGLAAALILLYRAHRRQVELQAQRDAPVVAASRLEESREAVFVSLDSADSRRIGLATEPLRAISRAPEERLAAEVVAEPERTAVLRAPVGGRLTVPGGARWPSLGTEVRAGVPIAQVSDARPLASPIAGVVSRVGAQPDAIVEPGQELLEIVDYSRPLVRVGWAEPAGGSPRRSIVLSPPGTTLRISARLVGPAPEADPVTRRPAYLYRAVRTWPGATPGTPVMALVPGQTRAMAGVLVPDRAVVQWDGFAWVYLQRAPGRFERVRLSTERPAPGGWLAGAPLMAGDTVVVTGAEELLSEEFRARVTVGDEAGE
ncbi:MAG TPA: HlyD family efflux transporter periplasmic adaptor subunit [Gemmatimonadales bacterium]|jgi:biotin carboxyl carrier protein|nr:HlyD family efflux transporter periplasmic adaptor subunit [Gemmatimonadales bacterium]